MQYTTSDSVSSGIRVSGTVNASSSYSVPVETTRTVAAVLVRNGDQVAAGDVLIELEDEESYDEAIENFKEKSMYDTGVTPEYGTQLVTLITCAYHVDNGKFVVVLAEK